MLEELVSTILKGTLNRITDESWAPASEDSSDAFSPTNLSPGLEITLIELRIDLTSTLDEVKRSYSCVCWALRGLRRETPSKREGRPTQARIPPTVHAAKYFGEYSSIPPALCWAMLLAFSYSLAASLPNSPALSLIVSTALQAVKIGLLRGCSRIEALGLGLENGDEDPNTSQRVLGVGNTIGMASLFLVSLS